MAKLTTGQRKALPKSVFGIPSKAPGLGSYPMPDRTHAIKAKELVGHAPAAKRPGIIAKANRVLGKSSSTGGTSRGKR